MEILAQYSLPLKHQHKIPSLYRFSERRHFEWEVIPVSEWIKVEKNGKWLIHIDLAFIEYSEKQQILEIKKIRFESEGQDHSNSKFY